MSSRKVGRRGASLITHRMLTERDTQLEAEEAVSEQLSIWSKVYKLMRCQVTSCNLGPYCWRDPVGKKHYKLRSSYLTRLVEHVQDGHILQTHSDVPKEIRQKLYTKEQQGIERRQKPATTFPPINITNVLPALSSHIPVAPDMPSTSTLMNCLDFPRPQDKAVKDYCAWQQSQVKDPEQKDLYQKAYEVIMKNCISLELIYQDPNPDFLIYARVPTRAALHIVGDIED
jgi:hypothetical protein